jgi:hypothetical protein
MVRLKEDPNLRFDVRFTFNRYPCYVMHETIDLLVKEDMCNMVFPRDRSLPSLPIKGDIE